MTPLDALDIAQAALFLAGMACGWVVRAVYEEGHPRGVESKGSAGQAFVALNPASSEQSKEDRRD